MMIKMNRIGHILFPCMHSSVQDQPCNHSCLEGAMSDIHALKRG